MGREGNMLTTFCSTAVVWSGYPFIDTWFVCVCVEVGGGVSAGSLPSPAA